MSCKKCLKYSWKFCQCTSCIWGLLATVITLVILYVLSGVGDVAYLSSQLKDIEIATVAPPIGVNEAAENSTVLKAATREIQKSIKMLKSFRKIFDIEPEMWDPEKSPIPAQMPNIPEN